MDYFSWQFIIWATSLGALSAISLPMGSLVALRTNPRPQFISILAAFGAGALIAALSVELVAPTVLAVQEGGGNAHNGESFTQLFALLIGLVLGGILFVLLDQLVNAHGGFVRKAATSISYFTIAERKRQKKLVERLSQLPLLHNVSTQLVDALVSMVRPRSFAEGEVIAQQGEDADALFFCDKRNGQPDTRWQFRWGIRPGQCNRDYSSFGSDPQSRHRECQRPGDCARPFQRRF